MVNRAERRKFHYIYKITRTDGSGKYYIGMHSTDDLEDGYFGSGKLITRAIKKHGKEKHSKEILEFLSSRQELKTRERELVNEEIVNDPLCMNLRLGGAGWDSSEACTVAVLGNKSTKRDAKAAAAKAHQTMRERGSARPWGNRSATFGMLGKTHGAETIKKMSESKTGIMNNQYGTCWVTNDLGSVKIKKDELDGYLTQGFRRGRK